MSQSDLEKFLKYCEELYDNENWGDPYAQKLLAMVRFLHTAWMVRALTPDMQPADKQAEHVISELNKIARDEK